MAREVIIRIISETPSQPSPNISSPTQGEAPNPKAEKKKKADDDEVKIIGAYMAKRAWAMVKSEGQYQMGKYLNATENYRLQTSVNNAMDTIDFGVNTATNVFATATFFGKTTFGAGFGAIVGIAFTALQKGLQTVRTYEGESQKIIENAYGNYFYGERSGFVAGGHGTEN